MQAATHKMHNASWMMRKAYDGRDAAGFIAAAQQLRELSTQALNLGFLDVAVNGLSKLGVGLDGVKGHRPGVDGQLPDSRNCSAPFLKAVMHQFSTNGSETIRNLGVSPEIDEYLFAEKLTFGNLSPEMIGYEVLEICLKQGRHHQFMLGFQSIVDETLRRQAEAMAASSTLKNENCLEYAWQNAFLNIFLRIHRRDILLPELPASFDEKLEKVFTNMSLGDKPSLDGQILYCMARAGLQKSLGAAICNAYKIYGDIEYVDLVQNPTAKVATNIFWYTCSSRAAPGVLKQMARFSIEDIDRCLSVFAGKKGDCKPFLVMKSCALFCASDDYRPEHEDMILLVLDVASLKLKREMKSGQLDYEVIREAMNDAGVPDYFQFKIGTVKKNKGKLLELALGF